MVTNMEPEKNIQKQSLSDEALDAVAGGGGGGFLFRENNEAIEYTPSGEPIVRETDHCRYSTELKSGSSICCECRSFQRRDGYHICAEERNNKFYW